MSNSPDTTISNARISNVQKLIRWRQRKISELGKEEYDKQNRLRSKESRNRLKQKLGKAEYDKLIRERAKNSREKRIQKLGKDEYNKILRSRALSHRKRLNIKLGAKIYLTNNPNTPLPDEEVLTLIGNAERIRLNRIKDKNKRDAAQAKGIADLGAENYWKKIYAKRKRERQLNPAMEEDRKARLRTPERRKQYAAYYRIKRQKAGFRIAGNIRKRVTNTLSGIFDKSKSKGYRNGSALDAFGCSIENLMFHFEQLFTDGMNLSNYGNRPGEWNVDHILCVAYFKKELESGTPEEIKRIEKMLNHYTNLVPLWSNDNRAKNDKFPAWVKNRGCCFWTDLHEQYYKTKNYNHYLDEALDADIERQIEEESVHSS